jgi:hypothetical protein
MGKKNKKDPIVIYWSPWGTTDVNYLQLMLDIEPKSLLADIRNRRAKNPVIPNVSNVETGKYHMCSAFHTIAENVFILISPVNIEADFTENGEVIRDQGKNVHFLKERVSSFDNSFSFDFGLTHIFFSEENVDLEITSPHMHKTTSSNHGYVMSAKYDISSWIRPFAVIFQMWENIKNIKIKEDEPLAYIKFHTDRPIIFKQFKLTETLYQQIYQVAAHKFDKPNQTLKQLYDRFLRVGMRDRVLKEIKANLID